MTLHQKLNQQIWDAAGRLYPGMEPSMIVMHPDTFDELIRVPEMAAKETSSEKGNRYRGIKVYRSNDIEVNKFIVV